MNARAYSMGNTASLLSGFYNPAGNVFSPTRSVALEYINKYGLKELSSYAGIVNYPNDYLNGSVYVSRYGFDLYHETSVDINVYKLLSKRIALGVRMNYYNVYYSDKEPSANSITADVGMLISIKQDVNISLMVTNPLRTQIKINEDKQSLPNKLLMGISYQPDPIFLLTTEVEKDFELPVIYKMGIEYVPIKQLSLRAGMWCKPFTPTFGVGVHVQPFVVDIAFTRHPVLGFQSCCGIQYNF